MKKFEIRSFDQGWFGASENSECGFGVQSLSLILGLARLAVGLARTQERSLMPRFLRVAVGFARTQERSSMPRRLSVLRESHERSLKHDFRKKTF